MRSRGRNNKHERIRFSASTLHKLDMLSAILGKDLTATIAHIVSEKFDSEIEEAKRRTMGQLVITTE